MAMPFVVLLSTARMNNRVAKLKKKRLIKHIVTISVAFSILFALIIVTGIMLTFELPPNNQKFTLKEIDMSEDKG